MQPGAGLWGLGSGSRRDTRVVGASPRASPGWAQYGGLSQDTGLQPDPRDLVTTPGLIPSCDPQLSLGRDPYGAGGSGCGPQAASLPPSTRCLPFCHRVCLGTCGLHRDHSLTSAHDTGLADGVLPIPQTHQPTPAEGVGPRASSAPWISEHFLRAVSGFQARLICPLASISPSGNSLMVAPATQKCDKEVR